MLQRVTQQGELAVVQVRGLAQQRIDVSDFGDFSCQVRLEFVDGSPDYFANVSIQTPRR